MKILQKEFQSSGTFPLTTSWCVSSFRFAAFHCIACPFPSLESDFFFSSKICLAHLSPPSPSPSHLLSGPLKSIAFPSLFLFGVSIFNNRQLPLHVLIPGVSMISYSLTFLGRINEYSPKLLKFATIPCFSMLLDPKLDEFYRRCSSFPFPIYTVHYVFHALPCFALFG